MKPSNPVPEVIQEEDEEEQDESEHLSSDKKDKAKASIKQAMEKGSDTGRFEGSSLVLKPLFDLGTDLDQKKSLSLLQTEVFLHQEELLTKEF